MAVPDHRDLSPPGPSAAMLASVNEFVDREAGRDTEAAVDETDEFVAATLFAYRESRQAQMTRLRAVFDYAHYFDALAIRLQEGASKLVVPDRVNALTPSARGSGRHSGLGALVEHMREHYGLGWRYSTLRAYRVLAGFAWDEVAACGSLRKALQWCRAERRGPQDSAPLKKRAVSKDKDRRLAALEKEVGKLRQALAAAHRTIAVLERQLRGRKPSARTRRAATHTNGRWYA